MPRHLPQCTQETHTESRSILPVYETKFDHGSHAHKAVCLPAQQQHALLRTDSLTTVNVKKKLLHIGGQVSNSPTVPAGRNALLRLETRFLTTYLST